MGKTKALPGTMLVDAATVWAAHSPQAMTRDPGPNERVAHLRRELGFLSKVGAAACHS